MASEKKISEVNLLLGQNISALRKKNKMSVQELADKLGVSKNAVWFYEKGERTPTLEKILQLSDLFVVSVDTLLKEDVNLREVSAVPCALIMNGTRYNFEFNRAEYDTQRPFTITIQQSDGVVNV